FYAESWALTDMLTSSPEYAPRFADLVSVLNSGSTSCEQAFARTYGKPADAILTDLREWVGHSHSSRRTLGAIAPGAFGMEETPISTLQARAIITDLLFAEGQWERVEQMDKELLRESPNDPEI